MRAALGILGIAIGAGASAIGVFLLAMGLARKDQVMIANGRRCVFVVLAGALLAVAAMEWALITHDFSIEYVAGNNARSTPLLFTITGLWAALEGSILLWVLILAGYLTAMALRFRCRDEWNAKRRPSRSAGSSSMWFDRAEAASVRASRSSSRRRRSSMRFRYVRAITAM